MKKTGILLGLTALCFTLTGCKFADWINSVAESQAKPKEGVTYQEFHEAAQKLEREAPFSYYTGVIVSGEWPNRPLTLDPTTLYFTEEAVRKYQENPDTWQEETAFQMFVTVCSVNYAWTAYPKAGDDIFYVYDYGFKWMSNANYQGMVAEFNKDGVVVDYSESSANYHLHFSYLGGPAHPTDPDYQPEDQ